MNKFLMTIMLFCVAITSGCTTKTFNTLGDLEYTPEVEKKIEFEKLSHKEVRAEYQELLNLFEDKNLKEQIERRIADVYMIEGANNQVQAEPATKSYYLDAIKSYKEILKKYPNSPDNAEVLYQLAKAYDLEGNQEEAMQMLSQLTQRHPNYKYIAEAHFRKGDIFFNRKNYKNARKEYLIVTQLKNKKLWVYAHYMLGWSNYKLAFYQDSIDAFAYVFDALMTKSKNKEKLSKSEEPLIKDSIRSMSLALARIGGAESIKEIKLLQGKEYIWRLYDDLGDYYLSKERYEDSANTFRSYVTQFNYAEKAPDLHSKLINTYVKGGFPKKALQEKESYVEYYGLGSKYAENLGGIKAPVKKQLKIYIDELAQHYHNQGQQLVGLLTDKKSKTRKPAELKSIKKRAFDAFDQAAHYYKTYLQTFPNDYRVGEITYLKAEAHYSSERFALAIDDYEAVAYKYNTGSGKQYGANSGYAAIISYQKHIDTLNGDPSKIKHWRSRAVESMLKFAATYHTDKRSASVLTNAAEYLFSLDQYERALKVASDLISSKRNLEPTLKKTAYGIMAHSQFKLQDYAGAEKSYFNQRQLTQKDSKEYTEITERLASAIYKNSELKIKSKENLEAVNQLLKIKKLAPNSSVRVTAQYDAASLLLGLEEWDKAIVELKDLIIRFAAHKLAIEFPRKLAFAYEKNENWHLAAKEYLKLHSKDPDDEVKRSALFLAAQFFDRSKNYPDAIKYFKKYARTYEQPFDDRMEARYQLALLYGKTKEESKKLFWLRRIVDGDKNSGSSRTQRSRWLAAWANIEYGNYFSYEFSKVRLRQPLAKSVQNKNKHLRSATERYQMAADYGILEFVTMSSFKIAELYQKFARELRAAPTPKGLSNEEKKIYAEIIEEQASPFDELAAELHLGNVERAWQGNYDKWIEKSFIEMKKYNPERFDKSEVEVSYGDGIR
ncbi:MAG: tetratricopeptide repeat protein [Pseudomonadota bacterium]